MKKSPNKKSTKIDAPSAKHLLSQWLLLSFGQEGIDKGVLAHKTIDYILINSDPKLLMRHKDFTIEELDRLLHQKSG